MVDDRVRGLHRDSTVITEAQNHKRSPSTTVGVGAAEGAAERLQGEDTMISPGTQQLKTVVVDKIQLDEGMVVMLGRCRQIAAEMKHGLTTAEHKMDSATTGHLLGDVAGDMTVTVVAEVADGPMMPPR